MRLSTSADADERLCDVEDRIEMLAAAVDAMADFDVTGPPTSGAMRGLAATLEELKEEINSIANVEIDEANRMYLAKRPKLRKVIEEVEGRKPVRVKVQR
jgi:hypothetical protein